MAKTTKRTTRKAPRGITMDDLEFYRTNARDENGKVAGLIKASTETLGVPKKFVRQLITLVEIHAVVDRLTSDIINELRRETAGKRGRR